MDALLDEMMPLVDALQSDVEAVRAALGDEDFGRQVKIMACLLGVFWSIRGHAAVRDETRIWAGVDG